MTTARTERAGPLQNNTSRPQFGGFPPLTSRSSGEDKTSQGSTLSQRFGTGNAWQAANNIWGNSIGSGYNSSRDISRSRGDLDGQPSGSGALMASSEAEPWSSRNGAWKPVDTTSPTMSSSHSGSNSPIRHRGSIQSTSAQALGDLANTSPYFTSRAVGQPSGSTFGRPKSELEPATHKIASNMPSFLSDDKENPSHRGRLMSNAMEADGSIGLRLDRSQFPGHLSAGGTPRDTSVASTRHSDMGIAGNGLFQQNSFPFAHTPHNSLSQRQSYSGRMPTFANANTQSPIEMPQSRDSDLSAELARFNFGGRNEHPSYTHQPGSEHSFPSPGNHPAQPRFKLNAQSPMWTGAPGGNPRGFGFNVTDGGADANLTNRYQSPSGNGVSHTSVSSAGSDRRGVGSPATYGANAMDSEAFSRPETRDSGAQVPSAAYVERRLQALQGGQQPAPFIPQQFLYNNAFAQAYEYGANGFRLPQTTLPYGYQIPVAGGFNPLQIAPRGPRDDVGSGMRSVLLEEFRANSKSNRRYELKDIYGHIVEFSGDTHGSRFIQQKLETANSDEKDQVFREIQPNALQLMTDVFGNYVIQKLFEHGSQVQKRVLAETMRNHVHDLSLQMYGCRVVQKALEHVLADQQAELVKELQSDILKCVKDQHGNHVVQKAIERVPAEHTQFIVDAFKGQVHSLATHPYGCRVVQRMLEYCPESEQAAILQELHQCASMLITDQYGNYVTQHIIAQGKPEDRAAIIKIVTSQLITLSKHKFASNVVEKSIQFGSDEERKEIVTQLVTLQADGTSPLHLLMKDQYGNYVIQKLLGQLKGSERERFIEAIKPQLHQFKKYNYGKQIAAIEKMVFGNATPNYGTATGSSTPLALDVNARSEAPTPSLTMEQNSPQTCSPPSTNASVDEPATGDDTAKAMPVVQIEGAEEAGAV